METIALNTRLKQGRESDYDRIHASLAPQLHAALKAAGVRDWRIWRNGRELFHLVQVEDYRAMRLGLAEHPANIAWQAQMAELLEVGDDYSGDDSGIPMVWSFAQDPAGEQQ